MSNTWWNVPESTGVDRNVISSVVQKEWCFKHTHGQIPLRRHSTKTWGFKRSFCSKNRMNFIATMFCICDTMLSPQILNHCFNSYIFKLYKWQIKLIHTWSQYPNPGLILGLCPANEIALLCNDVSHCLGANLESALQTVWGLEQDAIPKWPCKYFISIVFHFNSFWLVSWSSSHKNDHT